MRCSACGAWNADTATWCTQCYASFEASAPRESASDGDGVPPAAVPPDVAPPDAAPPDASNDRLRRSEDGVDWRCTSCDTWNPIERSTCVVCGTQLTETFDDTSTEAPGADITPATVIAASVLLPGAGHLLLGRAAAGLGRALLYVVWAAGGIALLRAASEVDGSILPALPLLTGAFVLLATSVLDALALRRGDLTTELLGARALLWLTVGVIGLTTLALIGSALSVSR